MNNNLQHLGWGLVGSPKGRQQVNEGVNKVLQISFDLDQRIGGSLPSPQKGNLPALYCLTYTEKDRNISLALAEYRPILEQGQSRSGSYFGAFIQSVNSCFSSDNILETLQKLNSYHYKTFIDEATSAYKENFIGKPVYSPETLNTIAGKLQMLPENNLARFPAIEMIYIHCEKGSLADVLKQLLENKLYYQFKNIFFSESISISQNIQKKNIPFIVSSDFRLFPLVVSSYQEALKQENQEKQKIEKAYSQQKAERDRIIAQQVAEQTAPYIKETTSANAAKLEMEKQLNNARTLAALGSSLVQEVGNKARELEQINLEKFATSSPERNTISSDLTYIKSQLAKLTQLNAQSSQQELQVIQSDDSKLATILAIVFGTLALLFLILFIWSFSENDNSSGIKKELDNKKAEITRKEDELHQKSTEFEKLQEQLKSKEKDISELESKIKPICDDKKYKSYSEVKTLCAKIL